jgi:V-type H+-transporting ATPase subunit a
MKVSVILGVAQMALGISMRAFNAAQFGKWEVFCFEFLPQFILLICLFGYMDLLIIVKWLVPWHSMTDGNPPSIITAMINMALKGGEMPGTALIGDAEYNATLATYLLLIGLICVPLMLFPKPFVVMARQKRELAEEEAQSHHARS